MTRSLNVLSGVLLVALNVAGCGARGGASTEPATMSGPVVATPGARAPDFTASDIDGHRITLSGHFGKDVVLLDFCSTWCEPCVAEFPHLRSLYEANKDKGFVILAISVDGPETMANVPGFARRNRLAFPMLIDGDERISALYNPRRTAPVTVLIDRTGMVVAIREGYTAGDEHSIAKAVEMALETPPARPLTGSGARGLNRRRAVDAILSLPGDDG